jgi:hypothetical protein
LYIKLSAVSSLINYNNLLKNIEILKQSQENNTYDYDTKELIGDHFCLGVIVGNIQGIGSINLNTALVDPMLSMVGSKKRAKGHEPANTRYAQCVKIAKKYWDNGGIMNQIELAELLYGVPEISYITTTDKEISENSLKKYLSYFAPEDRKFGNKGVKRHSFHGKKENVIQIGTKKAKEFLQSKKVKDFENVTKTQLSTVQSVEVNLNGDDALPDIR